MRRALLLAEHGRGRVSPNPMVGAVIVHDNRIIGEGFHAFYGGPHAEVNAINSVKSQDRHLLKDSTMYVTLEPCAHHGKTPPCANLIVNTGIPNVVIGSSDPNPLVAGKGIIILREAGIDVKTGVLQNECDALNVRFFKAHTSNLPWIILKWAQSSDGFIAATNENGEGVSFKISSPLSSVWMHRERAAVDAILIGANTQKIDKPALTTRFWGGNSPKKYVAEHWIDPEEFCLNLRKDGITSLMVEGGAALLESFLKANLFDEIRVEIAPFALHQGIKAPIVPTNTIIVKKEQCRDNNILIFKPRNN